MTMDQVREILNGKFTNEEDRQYWVAKLAEMEAKEARNIENMKYYKKNRVYDR